MLRNIYSSSCWSFRNSGRGIWRRQSHRRWTFNLGGRIGNENIQRYLDACRSSLWKFIRPWLGTIIVGAIVLIAFVKVVVAVEYGTGVFGISSAKPSSMGISKHIGIVDMSPYAQWRFALSYRRNSPVFNRKSNVQCWCGATKAGLKFCGGCSKSGYSKLSGRLMFSKFVAGITFRAGVFPLLTN